MGRITDAELRKRGVSDEDIETARIVQQAQRRSGAKVQQRAVIVGAIQERHSSPPVDLTERQMHKRGSYDQAALLLDQQAMQESSPERAERAREASRAAKELSSSQQIEFDFFGGGNVSIAFQYQSTIRQRLVNSGVSRAQQHLAASVLWEICCHLSWQSYECSKTAGELCQIADVETAAMARTLALLEQVGAIVRVKKGRGKVITVTPEGAYRGNIHHHGKAVERYRLDVIDGGKTD